jgi:hypothetical protein
VVAVSERLETLRDWAENRTMAPGDRSDLKWAIQELDRLTAMVESMQERIDWLTNREVELEDSLNARERP